MKPVVELLSGELHIHYCDLENSSIIEQDWATLAPAEKEKAERFRPSVARTRFVGARSFMRRVLADYIGCEAVSLKFDTNENGKPFLPGTETDKLEFNMSHSGDWCVLAVSSGIDVGVDIEKIREISNRAGMAERFFSTAECEAINPSDATAGARDFFTIWTRKEAIIKAYGLSLFPGLKNFSVPTVPLATPEFLSMTSPDGLPEKICLFDSWSPPGYLVAVAARGPVICFRIFN